MASVNKVILVGRLGQDPEPRYLPDGTCTLTLSVATSRRWKDRTSGQRREETDWHRVVLFERAAEVAAEFLTKGSLAYFEGRLRTRKWQDRDGADRYVTEVVAQSLQFLERRQDGQTQNQAADGPARPAASGAADADGFDDDIPF